MNMRAPTLFSSLLMALFLTVVRCQRAANDSGNCGAELAVRTVEDKKSIVCQVQFHTSPGTAEMQALVPTKGPVKFLSVTYGQDGNWTEASTFRLRDVGWRSFTESEDQGMQLVFGVNVGSTCRNEIDYICVCQAKGTSPDAATRTAPFKAEGLGKWSTAVITTTTPLQKFWHEGVEEGTFLGARCLAVESLHSQGFISWVIYRNGNGEDVGSGDWRVFFVSQTETHRAKDPPDLMSYLGGDCDLRYLMSTVNFVASRSDGSVELECVLQNATHTLNKETQDVTAFAVTPPIAVMAPVDEEHTTITMTQPGLLKCENLGARPAPAYVWSRPEMPGKTLNSSLGPDPAYLDLGEFRFRLDFDKGDFILCTVSNQVFGTTHTASVKYSGSVNQDKKRATGSTDHGPHYMSIILAVVAVLGLVVMVGMLVAEEVSARRDVDAWNILEETRKRTACEPMRVQFESATFSFGMDTESAFTTRCQSAETTERMFSFVPAAQFRRTSVV